MSFINRRNVNRKVDTGKEKSFQKNEQNREQNSGWNREQNSGWNSGQEDSQEDDQINVDMRDKDEVSNRNMPGVKYTVEMEKLKEICEDNPELDNVKTCGELKQIFEEKKFRGMWLKDLFKELGETEVPESKEDVIEFFFKNITVTGLIDDIHAPGTVPEPEPGPEPLKASGTPKQPEPTGCLLPVTMQVVSEILRNVKKEDWSSQVKITKLSLTDRIAVEFQDNFRLQYRTDILKDLVAVIKNEDTEPVAFGHLEAEDEKSLHIVMPDTNIRYDEFRNSKRFRLALFSESMSSCISGSRIDESVTDNYQSLAGHSVYLVPFQADFRELERIDNTLCIDFGTSNTAVASYGVKNPNLNEPEIVEFMDVSYDPPEPSHLYPTVVYVEDCSDASDIRYLFGYEAKKKVSDMHYDTSATVFWEIKRWIASMDGTEEIVDENGNTLKVERRSIIEAYLLHVISKAEQFFKRKFTKLHLTAPVKLKSQFLTEMGGIFCNSGYEIIPIENSIDEGIAIVYTSISKLIKRKKIEDGKGCNIMIMDCGGGTTDLASCEVSTESLASGRKIDIITGFVNGNSNFGGNNITFRIMQLLKIKLAKKYAYSGWDVSDLASDLIPLEESEILGRIEDGAQDDQYNPGRPSGYNSDMTNGIYDKFEKAYKAAEKIIPTVFTDNEKFFFDEDLKWIKRNYYYLWQLAEKIKIKLYGEDAVQIEFENDEPIVFDDLENYYLYVVNQDENLERKEHPAEDIKITINEIHRILCGDIYGLLNDLFNRFEVDNFTYYRLSGQSCKINLFMELLKEFIPGKKLRRNTALREKEQKELEKGSMALKLDCIRGSVEYIRDKECGKINPRIESNIPELIYDVCIGRVDEGVMILSRKDKDYLQLQQFSDTATKVEFLVLNTNGAVDLVRNPNGTVDLHRIPNGAVERKFFVELPEEEGSEGNAPSEISLENLERDIKRDGIISEKALEKLTEDLIDINPATANKDEYVRIVFAVPSKDGYGMNIYRLKKEDSGSGEIYRCWRPLYKNYEDESSKSFFDGRR